MKDAYVRSKIGAGCSEFVNGCPTLLIDSEPCLVVKKEADGNLVTYEHFKCAKVKNEAY